MRHRPFAPCAGRHAARRAAVMQGGCAGSRTATPAHNRFARGSAQGHRPDFGGRLRSGPIWGPAPLVPRTQPAAGIGAAAPGTRCLCRCSRQHDRMFGRDHLGPLFDAVFPGPAELYRLRMGARRCVWTITAHPARQFADCTVPGRGRVMRERASSSPHSRRASPRRVGAFFTACTPETTPWTLS